jgi:glycosyltransferase involved in cell wall biosynthesis
VNGLVFERERVDGLVEAIDELKDHRKVATEMGSRGRDLHRSEFTVEMMAKRIESVYLG